MYSLACLNKKEAALLRQPLKKITGDLPINEC
jgi:hypothetical protein